jgi:hypothetical protein
MKLGRGGSWLAVIASNGELERLVVEVLLSML